MDELKEDAKLWMEMDQHFMKGLLRNTITKGLGDYLEAPIYAEMYDREKKERRQEKRLAIFGILLSGLGWFGTGYQLNGMLLGLGMGLGAILVMAVCVFHIESGGE